MQPKMDLRIIKTHKALTVAFWQLLGEKRFEDITVKELCDRAMVRRATFYKHFADKYEFFAFVVRAKQVEYDAKNRQHINLIHPQFFYLDIIQNTLNFLNANEKLVQTVLESDMLPALLDILSRQIIIDITQKLKEDTQNGGSLPASPQVMAPFFTGALIYTMMWWVKQKKVSEDELMQELSSLLNRFQPFEKQVTASIIK